jgi:hypothetical protein
MEPVAVCPRVRTWNVTRSPVQDADFTLKKISEIRACTSKTFLEAARSFCLVEAVRNENHNRCAHFGDPSMRNQSRRKVKFLRLARPHYVEGVAVDGNVQLSSKRRDPRKGLRVRMRRFKSY